MSKRPESLTLLLAAANQAPTVSLKDRTITGLAVPYGPVGNSSVGPITFSQGSLTYSAVGRVKLLTQHDPERSVGYAMELNDMPDGLWAKFHVPESEAGDVALMEAENGTRDGLSVGVMLTAEVLNELLDKWFEGDDSPTAAAGELLEISQVSIPAFRDSRIDGSAAAALTGHVTLSVDFDGGTQETLPLFQENEMTVETSVSAPAQSEVETPAPAPAPAAFAGHAASVTEAPVYTFDGKGASFCRDAWNARFNLDTEAASRLAKFNTMMRNEDARQVGLVTAAVETTVTAPEYVNQGYRPDLLVAAVNKGRPLVSRIGTVTLTDATPFRIPVEGEFTGVGNHTEGTAHVAEGTLDAGDEMFTPKAKSGAYRLSRELVDATNPALDRIALNAMVRNYRRTTESDVAAALAVADAAPTLNVDTVMELRSELNNYSDIDDIPADFVFTSKQFYGFLINDVDGNGRPMLPSMGVVNGVGEAKAGYTGSHVDGTEIIKASALGANLAYLFKAEDMLIGESALQTFRFDEVEGPGVIKLALWAYFGAAPLRPASIVALKSAAA